MQSPPARGDDDLENRLVRALPNKPVSLEAIRQRREQRKLIVLLLVCGIGVIGIALMFLVAAFTSRSNSENLGAVGLPDNPEVNQTRTAEVAARDAYLQGLTRFDRNLDIASGGGWLQQTTGNCASDLGFKIESQRNNPKSFLFRLDRNVGLAVHQEKYNKWLTLAANGESAEIHYTNSNGVRVKEIVKPSMFAGIAMLGLLCVDQATYLSQYPNYDLIAIYTDLTETQNQQRLAWASRVAAQNLADPAEKIRNIESWERSMTGKQSLQKRLGQPNSEDTSGGD
ncbi:hypothetical protein WA1_49440 [Scytonema hofmannii PCC 7110]|uniref:Uncharacterized protein n=1 Tax=Scytonema hofmannii PCC 7110 TaxID=128403 RepID=A0A139WQQ2_9CYAN|nr:hypothetical protein [Scytonema hofmannii]KYC34764.1 hypothetical protein WA1_49440 [Scytonema hofmannii PCC 7110]